MKVEFKVKIPGHKQEIIFTKGDIRALLAERDENWGDLAARLGYPADTLSKLLNGKRNFPILRKRIAAEIVSMVEERSKKRSSALAKVG